MGLSVNDVSGIGAVASLVQDVADKIWPDPAKRAEAMLQVQQLDTQLAQGQIAIDQAEASNNSMFVAGWRPAVGWCCALAFIYHLIVQPFLTYVMAASGHTFPLPAFDSSMLNDVLMGMLGLGTMRSFERLGDKGNLPWQNK